MAGNQQLPWKAGEPSNVTSKECVAAEFTRKKSPHLTFFKADCNKRFQAIHESKMKYDN